MKDLKKAFFDQIRAARQSYDVSKRKWQREGILVGFPSPDALYEFVNQVGMFLVNEGVMPYEDLQKAIKMVDDYEKQLH